jgi:N-acetyl sugar amidotransferase
MKQCSRCLLPETYETIIFDEYGVCNICLQNDFKQTKVDWAQKHRNLLEITESYRGKNDYDCLIPFSGGKDSTYTLLYVVRELRLKPLVVQFDHGFMRPGLIANNERTLHKLGVDYLSFRPNWKVVKRLMLESLIRKGDFCWHCHTGIFAYPMQIAVRFSVPLIIWGEPSAEYTAYYDYSSGDEEEVNEDRFNRFVNLGISAEDMEGMIKDLDGFSSRDLNPYRYPALDDLKKLKYRSICLGSYIPWDVKKQAALIQSELGWKGDKVEGMPSGCYEYEKIECFMQGVRDYIKYLKRGYSRVSQMVALDLRNQRIDKLEAKLLILNNEGRRPPSLDLFLEYLEITETEFNEIVRKTVVAPHNPDFTQIPMGEKTVDFDLWYREGR